MGFEAVEQAKTGMVEEDKAMTLAENRGTTLGLPGGVAVRERVSRCELPEAVEPSL